MYRRLQLGEKIEVGDEFYSWNEEKGQNDWIQLQEGDVGTEYVHRYLVPVRREITEKRRIDLYVEFKGDSSVGILSQFWKILNVGEELIDNKHREEVREAFKNAFETLINEPVKVSFTDELMLDNES